ncbi:MAG TPA: hypothetical protein DCE44_05345 [Verrucomicrobiales bacterium]|nr:hypothetical protein [Verrucomicrobiales bacterium]
MITSTHPDQREFRAERRTWTIHASTKKNRQGFRFPFGNDVQGVRLHLGRRSAGPIFNRDALNSSRAPIRKPRLRTEAAAGRLRRASSTRADRVALVTFSFADTTEPSQALRNPL